MFDAPESGYHKGSYTVVGAGTIAWDKRLSRGVGVWGKMSLWLWWMPRLILSMWCRKLSLLLLIWIMIVSIKSMIAIPHGVAKLATKLTLRLVELRFATTLTRSSSSMVTTGASSTKSKINISLLPWLSLSNLRLNWGIWDQDFILIALLNTCFNCKQ